MAIETKTKEIAGHTVSVTQFTARRGLILKLQVSKLLLPAIGSLFGGKSQTDMADTLMSKEVDLGAALQKLSDNVEPEKFYTMAIDLMAYTRLNGQEINEKSFDTVFVGNYLLMYKILIFVLEVNYGDFFAVGGIGNQFKAIMTKTPTPPESKS